MRTFEEEYRELILWLQEEHRKIDAMNIPWEGGLDGKEAVLVRELGDEYRKRRDALREKYHR